MFRLTYALETAKEMQWVYRLLIDREWTGRNAVAMNPRLNGVFVSRSSLDVAFDDEGKQIMPLMARVTGNVAGFEKLLGRCGWQLEACVNDPMPFLFRLMALAQPA